MAQGENLVRCGPENGLFVKNGGLLAGLGVLQNCTRYKQAYTTIPEPAP